MSRSGKQKRQKAWGQLELQALDAHPIELEHERIKAATQGRSLVGSYGLLRAPGGVWVGGQVGAVTVARGGLAKHQGRRAEVAA